MSPRAQEEKSAESYFMSEARAEAEEAKARVRAQAEARRSRNKNRARRVRRCWDCAGTHRSRFRWKYA